MTILLQASDPHFGTEQPAAVDALVQLAHEQRPDVLLLSGDITQRATNAQFDRARAFVSRLQVPRILAIPGNHDIPLFDLMTRIISPYARYRRIFGPDLEPEFENGEVLVITLNSTRRYRHVDGALSLAQIDRVVRRLARAQPAQWRMILMHHPVAVTRKEDLHNLAHGHAAAVQRWAAAGADLVAGGHIHLPFVLPLRERWPHLPRAMWALQAGTAVSTRVRAEVGNSVNIIRLGASLRALEPNTDAVRHCVVERWDHLAKSGHFECVQSHTLFSALDI
jgi:3',5'-cyclic AMP phosphodiesterase CpdA